MNPTTSATGFVYLIQQGETSFYKIGFSKTPRKRLDGLQTGNPCKLRMVGAWPANQRAETALHQKLEPIRGNGEWFKIESIESVLSEIEAATSAFAAFAPKAKPEVESKKVSSYAQDRIAIVEGWRQLFWDYVPLSKEESRVRKAALQECHSYIRILATSNRPSPSRSHLLQVMTIKRLMAILGIATGDAVA